MRETSSRRDILRAAAALVIGPFLFAALTGSAAQPLEIVAVLRDADALAGAHDIEVRDGLAYIAGKGFTRRNLPPGGSFPYQVGKGGSLAIVDVMQPAAPRVLWFADTPLDYEDAETVLPLGHDRVLVGTRDLFLFDTSDRARPRQLAAIKNRPRVDLINGLARHGDAVFAANKLGHVLAMDVSERDTVRLLGSRETRERGELSSPHDAAFAGDLLVVVSPEGFGSSSRPGRLAVYRVIDQDTQKTLPVEKWMVVGKLEHPRLAGANRVVTRGKVAVVGSSLSQNADRDDGLRSNVSMIDLGDPARPMLRGSVDFPDARGPNGLEISGRLAFAAGGRTVQVIDVSDPAAPSERARLSSTEAFPGGADDAHDLVHHNGHLFVTAQTSHTLVVIKLSPDVSRSVE